MQRIVLWVNQFRLRRRQLREGDLKAVRGGWKRARLYKKTYGYTGCYKNKHSMPTFEDDENEPNVPQDRERLLPLLGQKVSQRCSIDDTEGYLSNDPSMEHVVCYHSRCIESVQKGGEDEESYERGCFVWKSRWHLSGDLPQSQGLTTVARLYEGPQQSTWAYGQCVEDWSRERRTESRTELEESCARSHQRLGLGERRHFQCPPEPPLRLPSQPSGK